MINELKTKKNNLSQQRTMIRKYKPDSNDLMISQQS